MDVKKKKSCIGVCQVFFSFHVGPMLNVGVEWFIKECLVCSEIKKTRTCKSRVNLLCIEDEWKWKALSIFDCFWAAFSQFQSLGESG